MGGNLTPTTLGAIAEIVMGHSPKGSDCNNSGNGSPLLNGPTEFGTWSPKATQFTTDPKRFSKNGDLLFCVRGSTTGRMNWADQPYAIGRGIAAIRHRLGDEAQAYLRCLIEYKLPILLQSATGSTFPNVSKPQLNELEIETPTDEEVLVISKFINKLDKKIELNRQTNQTLEKMAQALFKSWFVDFDPVIDNALAAGKNISDFPEPLRIKAEKRAKLRKTVQQSTDVKKLPEDIRKLFPSEFEESELGWMPKGWITCQVKDLSENIFSGGTPHTQTPEYWDGKYSWFSSGETRENLILATEKMITMDGVTNSSTKLSLPGDILIASAGQGHTRGQTSLNAMETYFNQSVVCIRPKSITYSQWLFENIHSRYDEMRGLSDSHSIRGSLTTKLISGMSVIKPSEELFRSFNKIVNTFREKRIVLICENKNLANLRDILLPKLISGELNVSGNSEIENIA